MDASPSAFKHGVTIEDIEHAVRNAWAMDDWDEDLRLYIGPASDGSLLEVIVIVSADQGDLAIHAMAMRAMYQRLLPGGER